MMPGLRAKIPADEERATVSADSARDRRARDAAAAPRAKGTPDLSLGFLASGPPEREAIEAGHGRGAGAQRHLAGTVAKPERQPPPEQGRNEDERHEAAPSG
ncbi:hypothetical protein [Poseidonocella sp. HB161398]|uniref:hypothetical protein n=1 Tax=Poseidonocella sp. HB161398 TaxID=2320855 RepID=UPI0011092806